MEPNLLEQRLKVQLLEAQQAFFQQSMELSALKLEKLDSLLRQERIALMALERETTPSPPSQETHGN
jgi:predicted HTH domain antitoxin